MSERLVIQIEVDEQPLANAYFHWGAYTLPALKLTEQIIEEEYKANTNELFKKTLTEQERELLWGVNLLRATGAEILEEDLKIFQDKHPLSFGNFTYAKDRNEGLIALRPESMDKNMQDAIGTVFIDLETRDIKFDVLNYESEEDIECLIDDGDIESVEDLPELSIAWDNLNFDNFDEFIMEIENLDGFYFRDKAGDVYSVKG